MKIGTTLWFGSRPFDKKIEKLLEIGFDYFEIALDYPFPEESGELRRVIRDYGLKPAFHAPLDMFLASPREEIFEASLKVLEKCLKFVGSFETIYFNFHALHFTPTFLFPEIREIGVRRLEKAVDFAIKLGNDFGFEICMENDIFFVEDFIVGDVKLTLDLGHFAIEAKRWERDYRRDLLDFCGKYSSRILVFHIHDVSFSKMCDHLPLRSGDIDLELLRRIMGELEPRFYLLEVFWKNPQLKEFASFAELEESLGVLKSLLQSSE